VNEYRSVPLRFERLKIEEMLERSRAFLNLMRARRSVRFFSDGPVPFASPWTRS
jgi:hypothetical protein